LTAILAGQEERGKLNSNDFRQAINSPAASVGRLWARPNDRAKDKVTLALRDPISAQGKSHSNTQKEVPTAQTDTHVMRKPGLGVRSRLDLVR
jgi:hypothetical protein